MAIKRAKTAFAYMVGTMPRVINSGNLYDESDEVVSKFPEHFEDVETHVDRRREARAEVEQATAAPGERRTRSTRRKRDPEPEPEQEYTPINLVDPDDNE